MIINVIHNSFLLSESQKIYLIEQVKDNDETYVNRLLKNLESENRFLTIQLCGIFAIVFAKVNFASVLKKLCISSFVIMMYLLVLLFLLNRLASINCLCILLQVDDRNLYKNICLQKNTPAQGRHEM